MYQTSARSSPRSISILEISSTESTHNRLQWPHGSK
jgi:hypothetical protein